MMKTARVIPIKPPAEEVRLLLPSLDDQGHRTVMRGVLDVATLANLKIDPGYQRERLTTAARKEIAKALDAGHDLPDIELGLRGDKFEMPSDDVAIFRTPLYIIDGQQRRETVLEHLTRHPGDNIRLGALVHFNSTPQFERNRFAVLNLHRSRVAPSVLLRNFKEDVPAVATLYGMTQQHAGVLYGRVCWQQSKNRGEVLTGVLYVQTALVLHARFVAISNRTADIPDLCEKLMRVVGLANIRNNVNGFWELIDAIWGVRAVTHGKATQFKANFLRTIARLFSDYRDFWDDDGKIFVIPHELRSKLKKFDIDDPEVVRLAGASGAAGVTLMYQLLKHLDSGKRTKRLRPWDADALSTDDAA